MTKAIQKGRETGLRFERKFVTSELDQWQLELIVKQHPALFTPIFWERQVNNIYLDTPDLSFFNDNVSGFTQRKKVRVRWYGDDQREVKNPVLEFKLKEGFIGYKRSFLLNDFHLPDIIPKGFFGRIFREAQLPDYLLEELSSIEPTLMNHYRRKYFRSFDNKFRCTIDYDLNYYDLRTRLIGVNDRITDYWQRVLEIKYDERFDQVAHHIISQLPLRVTKSSKYVNGIYRFRSSLPV